MDIFNYIINVFNDTFDEFNAFVMNKSINFFKQIQTFEC